MKKLIIILAVAIAACNSQSDTKQQGNEIANDQEKVPTAVQLNKGGKWKADEATKKNVAAMVQLANDSSYADASKKKQLFAKLQNRVDTLVQQCRMQGAEHAALHGWLENVLKDMKELKEEGEENSEDHADLKKDIESFYTFFE